MTPEDKAKLKKAHLEVIEKNPFKDDLMEGILLNGETPTVKQMVEHAVEDEKYYEATEKMLKKNRISLDEHIAQMHDKVEKLAADNPEKAAAARARAGKRAPKGPGM